MLIDSDDIKIIVEFIFKHNLNKQEIENKFPTFFVNYPHLVNICTESSRDDHKGMVMQMISYMLMQKENISKGNIQLDDATKQVIGNLQSKYIEPLNLKK